MIQYPKNVRGVNFICHAVEAKHVSLVGDFNRWSSYANPMKQMPDKSWFLSIELKHGHHRYAFLVDDHLTLDPQALGITRNDKAERGSLVAVTLGGKRSPLSPA